MEDKIKTLRIFFKISNTAFDFADVMSQVTGGKGIEASKMRELHKKGLEEIEKENPDLIIIDDLLLQMQLLAEENNKPKCPIID